MSNPIVLKQERALSEGQITFSGALNLIDSDDCVNFDIHYKFLHENIKGTAYYSDCLEDNDDLTVEAFIADSDNYGSFFLDVWYKDLRYEALQIVDDETFEPL